MTKKKKWKIHGLEEALANIPAEQRANVAAEITEALSDFDPQREPGERVPSVPPGTRICPTCQGTLVELGHLPTPKGESVCLLECESCDGTFTEGPPTAMQ